MCRSAGIPTLREPQNLLPDDPLLRPGDIFIPHWTIDGQVHSRHAIDFTAPSIDRSWKTASLLEKNRRSSSAGAMASSAVQAKLVSKNHPMQSFLAAMTNISITGQLPSRRTAVLRPLSLHFSKTSVTPRESLTDKIQPLFATIGRLV